MPEIQIIITRLEQQRDAIDRAIEALRSIDDETVSANRRLGQLTAERKAEAKKAAAKKTARKGGITPEGRKRLSEMMRKRWAAKKKAEAPTQVSLPAKTKRRKRRLTPEGRQRIVEETKRRWAAKRAADTAAQAKRKKTAG